MARLTEANLAAVGRCGTAIADHRRPGGLADRPMTAGDVVALRRHRTLETQLSRLAELRRRRQRRLRGLEPMLLDLRRLALRATTQFCEVEARDAGRCPDSRRRASHRARGRAGPELRSGMSVGPPSGDGGQIPRELPQVRAHAWTGPPSGAARCVISRMLSTQPARSSDSCASLGKKKGGPPRPGRGPTNGHHCRALRRRAFRLVRSVTRRPSRPHAAWR